MKKSTSRKIKAHEVYPKAGVAQAIMHQNMSNHYRRIYNAKPRVDTGPPFSLRPPATIKPQAWNKRNLELYKLNLPRKSHSYISMNTKCSRENCGEQLMQPFKPQITNTDAESKLRSLRVYHPPRKRQLHSSPTRLIKIKSDPDVSEPVIPWIHTTPVEVKTPPSKGSCSDSAYTEEGEGVWSRGESRGTTPISDRERSTRSDDLLYAKFVRDITDEVIRKGVFTDKALKKIFSNHIESQKKYLNVRRMQEEVDKLQAELGITKDDKDLVFAEDYTSSIKVRSKKKFEDEELMAALSQLNLSAELKADLASTLCLHRQYRSSANTDEVTVNLIHSVRSKGVAQSDDDSYEVGSDGSGSRPPSPLGLTW